MAILVKVDQQGRIVIPKHERERLGLSDGGVLELIPTAEGIALEHTRAATVLVADGVPVVSYAEPGTVTNEDTIAAIHGHRDRA